MKHAKVEIKISNQKNLGTDVESLKHGIVIQEQPFSLKQEVVNNFQNTDVALP